MSYELRVNVFVNMLFPCCLLSMHNIFVIHLLFVIVCELDIYFNSVSFNIH